jgi:hypothetical protein
MLGITLSKGGQKHQQNTSISRPRQPHHTDAQNATRRVLATPKIAVQRLNLR